MLRTCEAARGPDCEALLRKLGGDDGDEVPRVEVLLGALADEDWLVQVRHWHDPKALEEVIEISAVGPPGVRVEPLPRAPSAAPQAPAA